MTRAYFDSAYLAKFYVNEPDSPHVRALLSRLGPIVSSQVCVPEVASAFRRCVRRGLLKPAEARRATARFLKHIEDGVWQLVPCDRRLMTLVATKLATLPIETHLRALDAIHLQTAADNGFMEIWSNDRHLCAAAPAFALTPKQALLGTPE